MHDDASFSHPSDLHPPAPSFWRNPLLPQGLGLAALAIAVLMVLVKLFRVSAALGTVAAPLLGTITFLAAWASAIHLTGGEKFDDHPWV